MFRTFQPHRPAVPVRHVRHHMKHLARDGFRGPRDGSRSPLPNFTATLTGVAPLLMHSSDLADPIGAAGKALSAVSSKRGKTEADHLEMMELEFLGGMYWREDTGPYLPAVNIHKAIIEGARKNNKGKLIEAGLFLTSLFNPMEYDGPRDPAEMLKHDRFVSRVPVTVARVKVMRTRCKFDEGWGVTVHGFFDETVVGDDVLDMALEKAGRLVGLGDWRPSHGRFTHSLTVHE